MSASLPSPLAGEPRRTPRLIHAVILLVTSGLTVLVTAILGPSLPAMQAHFADVPRADFLVPLTMTAPMLMIGTLSVLAGALADRFGRKRLLVCAAALYALLGTAPLWLDSLAAIIASRIALGVTDAVLMTVSTTMIGDYYGGARREKLMALQTTVAATSAFLLNMLGGLVAEHGWRAPYAIYTVSLVLLPLMAIFLWEPRRDGSGTAAIDDGTTVFRPRLLLGICVLSLLAGIVFLAVPVHLGYLFHAIGVESSARIGLAYALNSLGVVAGTLLFGWALAPRLSKASQIALSLAIAALGFLLMRSATDYASLAVAGMVNGLGAGLLLPTMVTWMMSVLPFARRGFGSGAFQSSLHLGMFLNPIVVIALQKSVAVSRAGAIGELGEALLALAFIAALVAWRLRRHLQRHPRRDPRPHPR